MGHIHLRFTDLPVVRRNLNLSFVREPERDFPAYGSLRAHAQSPQCEAEDQDGREHLNSSGTLKGKPPMPHLNDETLPEKPAVLVLLSIPIVGLRSNARPCESMGVAEK